LLAAERRGGLALPAAVRRGEPLELFGYQAGQQPLDQLGDRVAQLVLDERFELLAGYPAWG
jgi:hypothetical protein